ncbi:MAG TPA: undecaprenyl-diphosphate phosphatase [Bacillota bacterium]|nr:undecaprenyl-diphosphate phosphatase [Bacillota bacterium]
MTDVFKAVILGIVEGLTEFLPISSTGHLILLNQFLTFDEQFSQMFVIVIQLGAILSVIVYFWNRINPFSSGKSGPEQQQIFGLWKKTILGIIPFLVLGFLVKDLVDQLFNPITVSIALVVWGVVLLFIENRKKASTINSIEALDYKTAFFIGIVQCLALIPGTSRSAATIVGGMLLGASRVVALEFSFFLAIPTMVMASGYSLLKAGLNLTGEQLLVLATGFVVSFLVAWLVIAGLLKFIGKRDFKPFAYYRIVLGILVLLYFGFLK